jgi:hypothetical protein
MKKSPTFFAMMAAMLASDNRHALPKDTTYRPAGEITGRYNLPKWDVNGHTIFARNEAEAAKRARKRGLVNGEITIKRIG